jgi:low affinity Fe/Cu permease
VNEFFRKFAHKTSEAVGSSWSFLLALLIIIVWAAVGPMFHFSDTWQLVINTGTTIVTFLIVFLIQNTQNRDAKGIHLKLDELIKATAGARDSVIDLDVLSDEQLKHLEEEYKRLCQAQKGESEKIIGKGRKTVERELRERETRRS